MKFFDKQENNPARTHIHAQKIICKSAAAATQTPGPTRRRRHQQQRSPEPKHLPSRQKLRHAYVTRFDAVVELNVSVFVCVCVCQCVWLYVFFLLVFLWLCLDSYKNFSDIHTYIHTVITRFFFVGLLFVLRATYAVNFLFFPQQQQQ